MIAHHESALRGQVLDGAAPEVAVGKDASNQRPSGEVRHPVLEPATPTFRLQEAEGAPSAGRGSAHGKVILLGEHACVYGTPAIAWPVPELRVEVVACDSAAASRTGASTDTLWIDCRRDIAKSLSRASALSSGTAVAVEAALRLWGHARVVRLEVDNRVPLGRGLGSSAACAAAAVHAVADLCGEEPDPGVVYELVQRGEQVSHGRASGVDARCAVASEPIWFRAGRGWPLVVGLSAVLVIADTGVTAATSTAVGAVRARFDQDPAAVGLLFDRAAALTRAAAMDVMWGRGPALGARLIEYQRLLDLLGLSTPEIDALCAAALDAGALGAKLTGGGLGGCVLALATDIDAAVAVDSALVAAGAVRTWMVNIGGEV
ncbi:mevalonate kinase [Nocardia sp. JMUB6875]|uniref:mevalonate kinase n=1 Tax=Nocardia sp. JMUB6875 TaxID=3158170 RepID=UPI0034E8B0B0